MTVDSGDVAAAQLAGNTVRAFLRELARVVQEVPDRVSGADSIADIVRLAIQHEVPRQATLDNGLEYAVHGIGCRITLPNGHEVDVDISEDGSEMFDPWRLLMFAESTDSTDLPSQETLRQECVRLVAGGALRQPEPGWFAVA
jgi:hypothetical protein